MGAPMPLRTLCTIFLFISACAFPLFFTIGVGLFSVIWFKNYYELIPLWFLNDALYGVPLSHFHSLPYVMTLAAVVLVLCAKFVRSQVLDTSLQKI
jgi:hypothetical protein